MLLPFQVVFDWAEQGDQQQSEGKKKEREKREGAFAELGNPGMWVSFFLFISSFTLFIYYYFFWAMAATWGFGVWFWLLAAMGVVDCGEGRRNGAVLAMMLAILAPLLKFERLHSGGSLAEISLDGKWAFSVTS